ncbi:MAG: biotin/lipoyl-binding protein, partial [bacterium]|nr:biotin/lipoyl-binding protein [bacterium]
MSRRNRTLIAASAAALAIVVVLVALHLHRSPAAADAPASAQSGGGPRVETATVRYGNVSYEVRGEGTISSAPGGISQASFTEAGRIAAVAVHIGEHVAAGQVLAQLDLAPLALQARQASGDLAAAEASTKGSPAPVTLALQAAQVRLQVAKRRLDRAERLAKSSGGNELSPEAAQVRQDQAKVAGDRSALQREQTLFKAGVAA